MFRSVSPLGRYGGSLVRTPPSSRLHISSIPIQPRCWTWTGCFRRLRSAVLHLARQFPSQVVRDLPRSTRFPAVRGSVVVVVPPQYFETICGDLVSHLRCR